MSRVTELIEMGDRLFSKRGGLLSHWQDIAEQFSPASADFTGALTLGEDYAADLFTSYPLLVAREMIDSLGMMLRPTQKDAAVMYVDGLEDHDGKRWLEWATKIQRKAMYDRAAQYIVAAKSGEHDFALFGQDVMTIERMPDGTSLLMRSWHLRDTAWSNGINGAVECVHRKWKPTAYELMKLFGEKKVHAKVREKMERGKDAYCEINCRHLVIPSDMYHGETKYKAPLVSIYIDVDNEHVMEETGQRINPYVISRWQRMRESQYAISPAVLCALPETRLLQAMTYTLLQAGEKAVSPPLLATKNAIRSEIDVRAEGITWVDADYDERKGAALQPLLQDKSGLPFGMELQQRSEDMIRKAFYIDKLQMPQRGGPQETAYEVSQRVQQYIREALPLIEPVESEKNGGVWERAFEVLLQDGAFGPMDQIPKSLRGADVRFKFASPLREQIDAAKGQIFLDGLKLIEAGAGLDPAVRGIPDAVDTMRDVLESIGWQAKWMRSKEQVAAAANAEAEAAQAQAALDAMQQASGVAKNLSGVELPGVNMV